MKKLKYSWLLLFFSTAYSADDLLDEFQQMIKIQPSVEVNLGPAMLGLLTNMTSEEKNVSSILKGLTQISVRVYDLEKDYKGDIAELKTWLNQAAKNLKNQGLEQLAIIREDDSLVYIMAQMQADKMQGLSVFALDDNEELVLVSIGGELMLKDLGDLMKRFNVDLSDLKIDQ
ncbi:MAG: DUF4252 domain-containing protein [Proteobacteria bacterium]|nr:DUF4252 domain-containing protein [Pseudomonadota bacterium]